MYRLVKAENAINKIVKGFQSPSGVQIGYGNFYIATDGIMEFQSPSGVQIGYIRGHKQAFLDTCFNHQAVYRLVTREVIVEYLEG